MALLLAMYQKMRLIREKNQLVLDQTKYTRKVDNVSKTIERVQKRYTSLFAQIDSQAKMMQSQATMMFQNMMGLGANSVNLNNYGGMNAFVMNVMGQGLTQGGWFKYKDEDGNEQTLEGMDQGTVQAMMNEYMQNGRFIQKKDPDDETKVLSNEYENGWTEQQVAAFMQAMRMGQMQQQQAQMFVQQANSQYANNVSIWQEAQKAKLEAEQDAALEPLNYQQTMWELEKTQIDSRLERIREEIQRYDQLAKEEAKNSAPTFGLG